MIFLQFLNIEVLLVVDKVAEVKPRELGRPRGTVVKKEPVTTYQPLRAAAKVSKTTPYAKPVKLGSDR